MADAGGERAKRVAIVQSSYIPWKGYFDLMRRVDEFVLFDDVQYTRRDWRSRNRIKTAQGPAWLTIPLAQRGNSRRAIKDMRVSEPGWSERHWAVLRQAYGGAPYFREYGPAVEQLYRGAPDEYLSRINYHFLEALRDILGIDTRLSWSMDYPGSGSKSDRLASICAAAGARVYVSGPSAKSYLDENVFESAGIDVVWMSYEGYPEYRQPHPPFEHHVSVLDLIFSTGSCALDHMLDPVAS